MDTRVNAGYSLRTFCIEFSVPEKLTCYGPKEYTIKKTEFINQVRRNNIKLHVIEPDRHNQNLCEGVICEVRQKWFRTMIQGQVLRKFWEVCKVMQRTSTQAGGLGEWTPIESVTGETVDISEYLDFGLYDQVWYHENAGIGERLLGRWLGVYHSVGILLLY